MDAFNKFLLAFWKTVAALSISVIAVVISPTLAPFTLTLTVGMIITLLWLCTGETF